VNNQFHCSLDRADGGGCSVAEAEPETITASELAIGEIPVDILQGDRDHGQMANAHQLAAERPDAAVHIVEGADHSFRGGDHEDETIEATIALFTLSIDDR
jgi:hypothetical protein